MNTPSLKLTNKTSYPVDERVFSGVIDSLYKHEELLIGQDFSICLVNKKDIRDLNRKYFGRDAETDVLAFGGFYSDTKYLGEVILNFEETSALDKSLQPTELTKLIIHGVLHLLGYDHINSDEKERMVKKEALLRERILNEGEAGY